VSWYEPTEEENRVLNCIKRWLDIKLENNQRQVTSADVDHSALLRRLLSGKEPLPEPPPNGSYNEVEGVAPEHAWRPCLYNSQKCEYCSDGHKWKNDYDIHPKCKSCGCGGHLACMACEACGYNCKKKGKKK